MKKIIVTFIASMATFGCLAREVKVSSQRKFDHALNKKSFALVFFYDLSKGLKRENPDLYDKVLRLDDVVHRIGSRRLYQEGDLQIVKVNLAKDNLHNLTEEYGVKKLPAFILFKNGVAVETEQKQLAVLYGFVTTAQLQAFIDLYLKKALEARVKEKAEEREYRREMNALYGPSVYWGVGYAGGYPGYYGPYWGGPYWGYGPGYGAGFWF